MQVVPFSPILCASLGRKWKKGRELTRHDIDVLEAEGFDTVVAAKLEQNDVDEDSAAEAIARVIAGTGVEIRPAATGRCNIYAKCKGLLELRIEAIDRINLVDEAFTVATLPSYTSVYSGRLVVSVKVIPFAVSRELLNQCISEAAKGVRPVNVFEYRAMAIGLIQTTTAWFNPSLLEKGAGMLKERAEALGSSIVDEEICNHDEEGVARSLASLLSKDLDMVFVLGATAIQDRNDVIPQGIVDSGGRIEHFGMPMDPG